MATIGIAMAGYKPNPKYFSLQLQSLIDQEFQDWNCVITFDSSVGEATQDPRVQVCLKDKRFRVLENERRLKVTKNFERAIVEVMTPETKAIAFADQDDIWDRRKLKLQWSQLQTCPPLSLVHCDMKLLREVNGNDQIENVSVWKAEWRTVGLSSPEHMVVRNLVTGMAALFDADLARKFPVIPEDIWHDHWFAIQAGVHGGVYSTPERLVAYRQHGSNDTGIGNPLGFLRHLRPRDLPAKARKKFALYESHKNHINQSNQRAVFREESPVDLAWKAAKSIPREFNLAKHCAGLALGSLLSKLRL